VAGCCECGDEPSGSCATENLVSLLKMSSYVPDKNGIPSLHKLHPSVGVNGFHWWRLIRGADMMGRRTTISATVAIRTSEVQ
jgi:hypothetical protein